MADGQEPEFTNLASNAWGGDAFCETLDYIFLSTGDGWSVKGVRAAAEQGGGRHQWWLRLVPDRDGSRAITR